MRLNYCCVNSWLLFSFTGVRELFLQPPPFRGFWWKISHITSQHSVQYPNSKTNRYFATAERGCLLESTRTFFDHHVCIAITHRSQYLFNIQCNIRYFSYETYCSTFLTSTNKYELKYPVIRRNSYVLKRNMCSLKEHWDHWKLQRWIWGREWLTGINREENFIPSWRRNRTGRKSLKHLLITEQSCLWVLLDELKTAFFLLTGWINSKILTMLQWNSKSSDLISSF